MTVLENRELTVLDPRTGEVASRVPIASPARCDEAVQAALPTRSKLNCNHGHLFRPQALPHVFLCRNQQLVPLSVPTAVRQQFRTPKHRVLSRSIVHRDFGNESAFGIRSGYQVDAGTSG